MSTNYLKPKKKKKPVVTMNPKQKADNNKRLQEKYPTFSIRLKSRKDHEEIDMLMKKYLDYENKKRSPDEYKMKKNDVVTHALLSFLRKECKKIGG